MNIRKHTWGKLLKPREEFVERLYGTFLTEFRRKIPVRRAGGVSAWGYCIRGLATGLTVLFILGGTATYANEANVGRESFLYPLKRAYERISVVFVKEEEKALVHLKLAERRLEELEAVSVKEEKEEVIQMLTVDFRKEIARSFATARLKSPENIRRALKETPETWREEKAVPTLLEKSEDIQSAPSVVSTPAAMGAKEAVPSPFPGENAGSAAPPTRPQALSLPRERAEEKAEGAEARADADRFCRSFEDFLERRLPDMRKLFLDAPQEILAQAEQCARRDALHREEGREGAPSREDSPTEKKVNEIRAKDRRDLRE